MNKKFSTLIAAFLAAGSFMSVEAGVVKITTPKTGHQYVIAERTWKAATAASWVESNGAVINASTAANMEDATVSKAGLWTVAFDGANYVVSQPATIGTATWYVGMDTPGTGLAFAAEFDGLKAFMTYDATSGILAAPGTDKKWTLTADAAVGLGATGTAVDFFSQTTQIAATDVPQNLKIGDKYLVINALDKTKPILVDEAAFEKIAALYPGYVLWTINTAGQYVTAVGQQTAANNCLTIAAGGAISLDATANANVFEANATEGLFVANAAGATSYLLQNDLTGVLTMATTATPGTTPIAIVASDSKAVGLAAPIAGYSFASSIDGGVYRLGVTTIATGGASTNNGFVMKETASDKSTVATTNKGSYSYWRAAKDDDGYYTFTNNEGVILAIDNITKFKVKGNSKGFYLLGGANFDKLIQYTAGALSLSVSDVPTATTAVFGAYQEPATDFAVSTLISKQGTSFSLLLKDGTTGVSDLKNNPFTGNLVPVQFDVAKDAFIKAATSATDYLLMRESDGQIIVLDLKDKWSGAGIDQHVTDGGYKFATLTQANMIKYFKGNLSGDRNLAYTFKIKHDASFAAKDAPIRYITVTDLKKLDTSKDDVEYYVASFEANKSTYLTVNTEAKNVVNASFDNLLVVKGKHDKNNPLLDRYVNISFVNSPSVKYFTETGSFAALNGKVLGVSKDDNLLPTEADKFLAAKPEGQWAVKMGERVNEKNVVADLDGDNTQFIFVNRENGQRLNVVRMYALGNNKYAVEYNGGAQFARNNDDGHALQRDTLLITAAPKIEYNKAQMDGYKNYTLSELQDQQYRLSVAIGSGTELFVTENHTAQHLLGMTPQVENAVNWRLVPLTAERTPDVNGYLKTPSDSVYIMNHSQYFDADINGYRQVNDTLAIVSYALQNTENGEYMTYESPQVQDILSMVCAPKSVNYTTSADLGNAYRFVLKEKADGQVNLIGVTAPVYYNIYNYYDHNNAYFKINLRNKLYGATTQAGGAVEVEKAYTQINSNDLFKVTKVAAPDYRKMAMGDTIRVFRNENDKEVLFEKGEFLNTGNIAQIKDMATSLYVDTAYVTRGSNNRYQYLLVVNPKYVPRDLCDIDGHPALHPDTTYGRFLVNLIDSAVYTHKNTEVHFNKYINDKEANEVLAKLGFVWGYRTADTLYVTTDKTFSEVKSKIDLGKSDFNVAKFAFRYINPTDASDKSFKIQTRYVDYNSAITVKDQKDRVESNDGYFKLINGVVVVANGYAKGEEFNLAADASNPTDNEGIETTEVSVIAGVGSVTINNAAGKKVAISNILGQTIAQTVITSDNATISVPAGIVVVSVEGEAAVKAIVK